MQRESVKSRLRRLLVKGFKSIQAGAGYNYSIIDVKEMYVDYENISEVPMINIFPIGEMYSSAGSQNGNFTLGMVEKIVVFSVDFIVEAGEDSLLSMEMIVADMEKYIFNNYQIPDPDAPKSANEYGCREAIIVSNQNFGIANSTRYVGVTFRIHCYIGQSLQSPGVRV